MKGRHMTADKGRISRLRVKLRKETSAIHERRNAKHFAITTLEATRRRAHRRVFSLLLEIGEIDQALEVLRSFRDAIS
jgi:hypothetical protein